MARNRFLLFIPLAFAFLSPLCWANITGRETTETRLILFGGGELTLAGVAQFVKWARPSDPSLPARILVITWSTSTPGQTIKHKEQVFNAALLAEGYPAAFGNAVHPSPSRYDLLSEEIATSKAAQTILFEEVEKATAIFFSGGDQRDAIDVIRKFPEVETALQAKYRSGTVFGGTSAGTALMSNPMIMGEENHPKKFDTEKGLGLLPRHILVDQHFLKRKRLERLMVSLLKNHTPFGLGIEEDGAIAVTNSRMVQVLGEKILTILLNLQDTSLDKIRILSVKEGQVFDLSRSENASPLPSLTARQF